MKHIVPVRVVGTATSPEFTYPMKDAASILPEPKEFGIVMMPLHSLQVLTNMSGQVNQIVISFENNADQKDIVNQIEEILHPYGLLSSYPRKDQLSHAVLEAEIDGLKTTARYMPLIFFVVAAGIQFILLSRLIRSQRLQIGVMKATGYHNYQLIKHYTSYALLVSLLGALLGSLSGLSFASIFSQVYAQYFNLPEHIGGINARVIVNSFIISLLSGGLAGILATKSILRISPAQAMRPEPPKDGGVSRLETIPWVSSLLSLPWRMSIRVALRNRGRFLVTVLGVSSSVMLLFLALFSNDSVNYMLERHFEYENCYDYSIHFDGPVSWNETSTWKSWPEVRLIEPVLDLPVQFQSNRSAKKTEDLLSGLEQDSRMKNLYDQNEKRVLIPEQGIVLNERTARKLNAKTGDLLTVETRLPQGPKHSAQLKVLGIYRPLLGGGSYTSFAASNRLIDEADVLTSVMVSVLPGQTGSFEQRLQPIPSIRSIISREREKQNYADMMESMIFFIAVMTIFAAVLGLAIVYNASIMNYTERSRELASLKVLGYTQRELQGLLFREVLLQTLLGIVLGLPAGRLLGGLYISSVSTDLYSMPIVVEPLSYVLAALGGLAFALIGYKLAVRRLSDLNMVEALKNHD